MSKNPDVEIGLYIRNLNNGPWFGINENTLYSPASLMKLPVLMTYLKWIEEDPTVANKRVIFHATDTGSFQYYQPEVLLIEGREYTVKELLEEMIIYSDNQSMHILLDAVPGEFYNKVSTDLGITVPGVRTPEDFLSVKDVATFFRILYNASYLDRDTSEYALSLLSRATFHKGLNLGVPENIKIAHKFGERGNSGETGKGSKQLHDCGIVYYAKYPYLACMVTKGDDFEKLSQVISGVSKIVYEEISKAFP